MASAARAAARLADYPELAAICDRMQGFADKASKAVHRGSSQATEFPNPDSNDDVEFPTSSVVNLVGNVRADQPTLRFELSGDQVVIARPGTKLILFYRTRAVPRFTEAEAKDVEVGDRVCIIGDAFLEMALPLLNITARAAEEIRDYHNVVLERFGRISGASDHERLAHVVAAMAVSGVTVQRASYWIDLNDQLNVPIHEVVPDAPRDRVTFLAFMKALGVSEAIASRFWTWAVIAQRTSRLRAAMNFHDAYRTILIDNYAAQSSNPERARDIRASRWPPKISWQSLKKSSNSEAFVNGLSASQLAAIPQELKEAVCNALVNFTVARVSGSDFEGRILYGRTPRRSIVSGQLLPRFDPTGLDDETSDIRIAALGMDFHLDAHADDGATVMPRFSVYVRVLPDWSELADEALGLEVDFRICPAVQDTIDNRIHQLRIERSRQLAWRHRIGRA